MEGETAGDFDDWELLADSDSPTYGNYLEIEDVSDGMIHVDYFSANGSSGCSKFPASEDSDNRTATTVDPSAYHTQSPLKDSGELWTDSAGDPYNNQCEVMDSDSSSEFKEQVSLGFMEKDDERELTNIDVENEVIQRGLIDLSDSEQFDQDSGKNHVSSDSDGDELADATMSGGTESIVDEIACSDHHCNEDGNVAAIEEEKFEGGEVNINRRRIVRWNFPIELLLRYCSLLRANPIWSSLSVAAAVAGLIVLSRKLYMMKHKRRTMPLRISVDDKKVSQFTSRSARLNKEAYSVVVRHIPMIRHNIPPTGVAQMSLR